MQYKNQNPNEDINFFDKELKSLQESVSVSLLQKRLEIYKSDPMEELLEVLEDVEKIETNLSRSIEISHLIIDKNKGLAEHISL
mgnify:CR=1 FL=1